MDNNTMNCGSGHCGGCCGGEMELTQTELDLLHLFAQLPFLPVARQSSTGEPVFFDSSIDSPENLGAAVTALCEKRLIRLDYDLPLVNFDYSDYEAYSCKGSMALTARGQDVIEQLEIQGIEA